MSRQIFMEQLRKGLRRLPPAVVDEITADYEAHFTEGAAAGRSETELAAALGDPDRLARELRAEAGLKRWEAERSPSAAAGAVWAVFGLGAVDLLILLPVLTSLGGTLLSFVFIAFIGVCAGAMLFIAGPFVIRDGVVAAEMLAGLGVMAASVCLAAVTALVTIGLVNALVWYGRLHMRLLKPMLSPSEIAA